MYHIYRRNLKQHTPENHYWLRTNYVKADQFFDLEILIEVFSWNDTKIFNI